MVQELRPGGPSGVTDRPGSASRWSKQTARAAKRVCHLLKEVHPHGLSALANWSKQAVQMVQAGGQMVAEDAQALALSVPTIA